MIFIPFYQNKIWKKNSKCLYFISSCVSYILIWQGNVAKKPARTREYSIKKVPKWPKQSMNYKWQETCKNELSWWTCSAGILNSNAWQE